MKTYYRHMTPDKANSIRLGYFSGNWTQKQLASIFGVTQSTIARIIADEVWI